MHDIEQCREWIAEIREHEDEICTEWERGFLDDVEMKVDNDRFITEKEIGIIKKIYNKLP